MDPITAVMLVSAGVEILGKWSSNKAKARQEAKNALFYKKQADFARSAMMRQQQLAEFEYTSKIGQQVSAYAASGVALEGSAVVTVAGTLKNFIDETFAIREKGAIEIELASMRGQQSEEVSRMLNSTGYNMLQATGTAIGAASDYTRAGGTAFTSKSEDTTTTAPKKKYY